MAGKCPTGKYPHRDRAAASSNARRIARTKGFQLHPYACAECGRWHLSNWTLADYLQRTDDDAALRRAAELLGKEIEQDYRNLLKKIGRQIQQDVWWEQRRAVHAYAAEQATRSDRRRQIEVLEMLARNRL